MSNTQLFGILALSLLFTIQVTSYAIRKYRENNPKYLRVYKFMKSQLIKIDLGYSSMTDLRYKLMTKFDLYPVTALECMEHIHDPTNEWFKENIYE